MVKKKGGAGRNKDLKKDAEKTRDKTACSWVGEETHKPSLVR